MILLDTSGLLAALDASERRHVAARSVLAVAGSPGLLSPFVLAELDYLLHTRVSGQVARSFLADVANGAYQLEPFGSDDVAAAAAVMDRFADLAVGIADASIVVLADRHAVYDVLTLDERHFRTLRGASDQRFRIMPADQ